MFGKIKLRTTFSLLGQNIEWTDTKIGDDCGVTRDHSRFVGETIIWTGEIIFISNYIQYYYQTHNGQGGLVARRGPLRI